VWLVLSARSPADEQKDVLAEGLLALGGSAIEDTGDVLSTWINAPQDAEEFVMQARVALAHATGGHVDVTWRLELERDWLAEWRRGLGARRVGERIIVTPTWIEPEHTPDDIVITIDPQMAFGTGEHATTRIVLELMQKLLRPGDRVLDVGTGSAILAIAAARLGSGPVDAVESDADALANAHENIVRNGAQERVQLAQAQVDLSWLNARAAAYDGIVANVLSSVLRPLLPGFMYALRPGGYLILCGILREEAAVMRTEALAAGFTNAGERVEDEWWGGAFYRPI
jgi:ribosomal protein L11 methyltransferase